MRRRRDRFSPPRKGLQHSSAWTPAHPLLLVQPCEDLVLPLTQGEGTVPADLGLWWGLSGESNMKVPSRWASNQNEKGVVVAKGRYKLEGSQGIPFCCSQLRIWLQGFGNALTENERHSQNGDMKAGKQVACKLFQRSSTKCSIVFKLSVEQHCCSVQVIISSLEGK